MFSADKTAHSRCEFPTGNTCANARDGENSLLIDDTGSWE